MGKIEGCQNSRRHVAPFYTVQTVAREVGPGTRKLGHSRAEERKTVGIFCADCLLHARIILEGKHLIPTGD
jgi:hypothetical protein